MGYYDEGRTERNKRGGKGGYFLSGLAGIVIGAGLVVTTLPSIVDYQNNDVSVSENELAGSSEQVAIDVTTDVTQAVEKAKDAVVGITNIQASMNFFGSESTTQEAGSGSGVIYKKDGDTAFIVTNYHVIEGAQQLEVTLADGTKEPAELLGGDVWTDLAVLTISGANVEKTAQFGDSEALKIGEPVLAIGNPLGLEFSGSVTQGVVSGLERAIPVDLNGDMVNDWQAEVLQTDAAINPGNSGGALVNIAGQVIGINSMKIAQSAVEGIGLSIPIDTALPIIEDLESFGEVKRPAMGVTLQNVNELPSYHQQETLKLPEDIKEGVIVEQVLTNSPAAKAGLQEYDVITALDGEPVQDVIALRKYMYNNKKEGDTVNVTYYRDGKQKETEMTLVAESDL
ncbi:trypsin-like peptidase domain-containing protein [Domibacillus sp. A3M-37]|uniref:S1C family serine protease n=1 Tax=Domibacillus sp. A3M-37 TaxID=2962037 RepID=UPI0020B8D89C|nr:trypsin-like peptidase domain-containing protein [Domibacillus sp. A3M-37]MCP3763068.1 trypsin-like peptidase domain-containing protein [Domibacillus sp. A3M-37]